MAKLLKAGKEQKNSICSTATDKITAVQLQAYLLLATQKYKPSQKIQTPSDSTTTYGNKRLGKK